MAAVTTLKKDVKMSNIGEIDGRLKAYRRGLITEAEAIDSIKEILSVMSADEMLSLPCPVLDVYGLGPDADPEAYGLPRRD